MNFINTTIMFAFVTLALMTGCDQAPPPPSEKSLVEKGKMKRFPTKNSPEEDGLTEESPPAETTVDPNASAKLTQSEFITLFNETRQLLMADQFEELPKRLERLRESGRDLTNYHYFFGDAGFAAGDIANSVKAYDALLAHNPSVKPKLWQRGIALYYNEQFAEGAEQFDSHQTYNSQDVENSVWQLLCRAKATSVEEARAQMIPIEKDRRPGFAEIFGMFAGNKKPEDVLSAINFDPKKDNRGDGTVYHVLLYIGLYHEMMGETEASAKAIDQAIAVAPKNSGSFMNWIARVHKDLRTK